MFIAPTKSLAHLDRLSAWQRGEKAAPVTVEWDLSSRCYLGCQYCHFAHTHSRGPWTRKDRVLPMAWDGGVGDLANPALVRRGLREMATAGVQAVVWSGGGEPTVHPQWLSIMETAADAGLKQGMYTAGGLLNPVTARILAQHATWVVVSLDAADAESYQADKGVDGFDAACQGARLLAESGDTVVGVSFLLHERNWPHVPAMQALGRALGATYVTFRPTIETQPDHPTRVTGSRAWITDAIPLLEAVIDEGAEADIGRFLAYRDWQGRSYDACHGIKLSATITPDGRVWICPQRRGMAGSDVGDLRRESFADVWQRHPGHWTDFASCRVMCRLHLVNEALAPIFESYAHQEFV